MLYVWRQKCGSRKYLSVAAILSIIWSQIKSMYTYIYHIYLTNRVSRSSSAISVYDCVRTVLEYFLTLLNYIIIKPLV